MRHESIMEEMADIALLRKRVEDSAYFTGGAVSPTSVRWGCMRILVWLRTQSVAMRAHALALGASSDLDTAVLELIESSDALRGLFRVHDGFLTFSDECTLEETIELMVWAKENYNPPVYRQDSEEAHH